jgi:CheY-like chemotaxis protein
MALSCFRPHYYDLVMLDVKMPKIDGLEFYNEIKKIDSQEKICFITATDKSNYEGMGESESEQLSGPKRKTSQQYFALKKDMYLQKPISNDDLVNEIKERTRTSFDG